VKKSLLVLIALLLLLASGCGRKPESPAPPEGSTSETESQTKETTTEEEPVSTTEYKRQEGLIDGDKIDVTGLLWDGLISVKSKTVAFLGPNGVYEADFRTGDLKKVSGRVIEDALSEKTYTYSPDLLEFQDGYVIRIGKTFYFYDRMHKLLSTETSDVELDTANQGLAISPDGKKFAFSTLNSSGMLDHLYIADKNLRNEKIILKGTTGQENYEDYAYKYPVFSADNRGIWCYKIGWEWLIDTVYVDISGKTLITLPSDYRYIYLFNIGSTQYLSKIPEVGEHAYSSCEIVAYQPGDKTLTPKANLNYKEDNGYIQSLKHCFHQKTNSLYFYISDKNIVCKINLSTLETSVAFREIENERIGRVEVFDDFICMYVYDSMGEKTYLKLIEI